MPLGGLNKRRVIRDLALTAMTQQELADKYGVTRAAISAFKMRNAEEIAAVAADADNEYAGIWIADKANRLTAYGEIYEAMQALKSVAEEMGQLPTRLQVSGEMATTTTYRIENVNPEDLK